MRIRTSAGLVLASFAAAALVVTTDAHPVSSESVAGQPVVVVIADAGALASDCPWDDVL